MRSLILDGVEILYPGSKIKLGEKKLNGNKKLCEQIMRQLEEPMKRRNDSNLLILQSQTENILHSDLNYDDMLRICNQMLRQLSVPMRRCDDWRLIIVKEKVKSIIKNIEANKEQMN